MLNIRNNNVYYKIVNWILYILQINFLCSQFHFQVNWLPRDNKKICTFCLLQKKKNSSSSMLSFKIETRSCKANLYVTDHFRNQKSLNVKAIKFRLFLAIKFPNHNLIKFEINLYNSVFSNYSTTLNTLVSKNAKIADIPNSIWAWSWSR